MSDAHALVTAAVDALTRGEAGAAVELLGLALERDPAVRHGDASARTLRCLVLLDLGEYAAARGDALQVLAAEPEAAPAWLAMGRCHAGLGDHHAALRAFDRALALRADWGDAHWHRGSSRAVLQDLSGALDDLDAALRHLAPHARDTGRQARIHEARAQLLLVAGRRDLARQDVVHAAAIWDARGRTDQRDRVIALAKALGL